MSSLYRASPVSKTRVTNGNPISYFIQFQRRYSVDVDIQNKAFFADFYFLYDLFPMSDL